MIDKKFAEHFADDWIDSWNAHDLSRILSHDHRNLHILNNPGKPVKLLISLHLKNFNPFVLHR